MYPRNGFKSAADTRLHDNDIVRARRCPRVSLNWSRVSQTDEEILTVIHIFNGNEKIYFLKESLILCIYL